ncbi:MAG: tRNA lysidine(34) synthetase TilS [Phenylobacterium zucineum]|nr:MAG: tRNA lysidine(34) synthetase TilS [Phenylobacterium zucineum]
MRGLDARARDALDRRLLRDRPAPVAVALSGGGDSLALTLIADAWAREAGRELLILTVDHGLRPESRAWTASCRELAARLGRPFRVLAWDGDKPATGLPAAARAARHALLADAAREAGARVVLLGHTADDLAEAAAMRAAGSTTPSPREWSPSPAWPEGRGVFLLRPLLTAGRAELRDYLTALGERWVDDPANTDPRYARARARLAGAAQAAPDEPAPLELAAQARETFGVITLARGALRAATPDDARRFVAMASVSAGGGDRLPATTRVAALAERLRGEDAVVATLAGARVEADAAEVRLFREAGEVGRGGLREVELPGVWDGRFELGGAGRVRRLHGLAGRLPRAQQAALRGVPAAARGALPAVIGDDGAVGCPALTGAPSLVGERLRTAAGLVAREPG